jgi:uncharacterized protein YcfJ
MESIKTASRIHPLMAAAAVSVVVVSLAGTAAITGLLPSSHGAAGPQALAEPVAQPVAATPAPAPAFVATEAPAPVVHKAAVVKHVVYKQPAVQHRQVAYRDDERYDSPAPAPMQQAPVAQQPNYVGIGVGAVVGGLLGNQVGGGNGRKLATVAGVIGGGMLGNQIANQNAAQGR